MRFITFILFITFLALELAHSEDAASQESSEESSQESSEESSEENSSPENECMKELKLKNGSINTNSPNYKCYQRCVYLKYELIDDSGQPILNSFPSYLIPIVSSCNDKTKTKQKCERESSFATCYEAEITSYYDKISPECGKEVNNTVSKDAVNKTQAACFNLCMKDENRSKKNDDSEMGKDFIAESIEMCKEKYKQSGSCEELVHNTWHCFPDEF